MWRIRFLFVSVRQSHLPNSSIKGDGARVFSEHHGLRRWSREGVIAGPLQLTLDWGHPFQTIQSMPSDPTIPKDSQGRR